jgi:hypothetical protein
MSDQNNNIFPLTELSSARLTAALNNLHERTKDLESRTRDGEAVLSGRDRAILDEAAGFFGVHSIVANTIESKSNNVADIDPNTGLPKVEIKRPEFRNVDLPQTGA